MKPEQLLYAKSHEWVSLQESGGQKIATVGISAFCGRSLDRFGPHAVTRRGKKVSRGQVFGEIESVKAVCDLYARSQAKSSKSTRAWLIDSNR